MAPLIVITGPTGSGKTGLAIELAETYDGEIICADSRTIYKGMDIGTAKPTAEEQARVPHHLLDVVEPGETFTAADFQKAALQVIADTRKRGKVPFLVGGTGLYIDAVVLEYRWPERTVLREGLDDKSVGELQLMLEKQHIPLPENSQNKRHLVNALIRGGSEGGKRSSPQENTYVVAIATPKNILEERIVKRAHDMFDNGIIDEATTLAERYGWGSEAMTGNIYPIIRRLVNGEITRAQAIELFVTSDRRLVKRQLTWARRHDYVRWLGLEEAKVHIETILR